MLRVVNQTHDLSYVEWNPAFIFEHDNVSFHALWDIKADPWQRNNLWETTPDPTRRALHAELAALFECTGTPDRPSNCP